MIRLRIERGQFPHDYDERSNGILYYEDGKIVGRVIIEQRQEKRGRYQRPMTMDDAEPEYEWVPVEVVHTDKVIECPTE